MIIIKHVAEWVFDLFQFTIWMLALVMLMRAIVSMLLLAFKKTTNLHYEARLGKDLNFETWMTSICWAIIIVFFR